VETIYERPRDYDLEHEGDDEDIRFYVNLVRKLRPTRVLELAAGSGRVTIPLAQLAAREGFTVVGLERSDAMIDEAERKRQQLSDPERRSLTFLRGDLR
jgi:ubiquinone/menaquinone biosynthesis C-methylase UbiE